MAREDLEVSADEAAMGLGEEDAWTDDTPRLYGPGSSSSDMEDPPAKKAKREPKGIGAKTGSAFVTFRQFLDDLGQLPLVDLDGKCRLRTTEMPLLQRYVRRELVRMRPHAMPNTELFSLLDAGIAVIDERERRALTGERAWLHPDHQRVFSRLGDWGRYLEHQAKTKGANAALVQSQQVELQQLRAQLAAAEERLTHEKAGRREVERRLESIAGPQMVAPGAAIGFKAPPTPDHRAEAAAAMLSFIGGGKGKAQATALAMAEAPSAKAPDDALQAVIDDATGPNADLVDPAKSLEM